MDPNYHLFPRHVGQTLVAVLRELLSSSRSQRSVKSVSWEQVRRLIRSRRVTINGNVCMDDARRMKLQDVIHVLAEPMAAAPTVDDLRLLYTDEHIIVVDKPSGITTTRHHDDRLISGKRRQIQPTLDELLPMAISGRECRESHRRKSRPVPPVFAVHRIDRETSGVLVFARTKAAEHGLIPQFREHSTFREYLAICTGVFPEMTTTYRSRLVRDRGDGLRGSTKDQDPNTGKSAVTHVERVEILNSHTLIRCRLETGRTHQIRIHLLESGHPLAGDRMYRKTPEGDHIMDESGASRTMLHATILEFTHPISGQRMRFQSRPPRDFLECLRRLAKND
ncbi:MAG: RluA family pseudouridine synthase [Planctomycetia bacterium]|nr:RluA family pseudouridine synthase [Planctomycetia bacterium]